MSASLALAEHAREACAESTISELEALARAAVDELRNRGRALAIVGDQAHHHDALTAIESLAVSARTVASLRATRPDNDPGAAT